MPGKLRHHWRPMGSIPGCVDVDRDGTCLECLEGMALSHGQCVVPAEVYHVDLDGDLLDKAAHGSTSAEAVNMIKVGLLTSVIDCDTSSIHPALCRWARTVVLSAPVRGGAPLCTSTAWINPSSFPVPK